MGPCLAARYAWKEPERVSNPSGGCRLSPLPDAQSMGAP
jgi:hypothetical protein